MESGEQIRWKQLLVTMVVAFGIAILVNRGVLKLFDQRSADRATHSLVGIILLMAYVSRFVRKEESRLGAVTFFFLALIPCYLGTVFPDLDITLLGIGAHRNPVFHSSASFLVLWSLVYRRGVLLQTLVLGYGVGLASHLWWDVLDYGDVRWIHGEALGRLWLSINGAICLLPLLIYGKRSP
jgi:hypothetical protein